MKKSRNKSIEKIEVNSKNIKLRFILFVVFVFISVIFLSFAIKGLFDGKSGWQTITTDSVYGSELTLDYNATTIAERKGVYAVYREQTENIYKLFDANSGYEDSKNVYYINHHPNEIIEVDSKLYDAFALMQKYNNDSYYLGPIYEVYNGLFGCEYDYQTKDFDPNQNEIVAQYFDDVLSFIKNKDVELVLGENNQVCLKISDDYLNFINENEIKNVLDFSWIRNAFVVDCLADKLVEYGYTRGILTSYNGFSRSFLNTDEQVTLAIVDDNGQIVKACDTQFSGFKTIVNTRNFEKSEMDMLDYYRFEDGTIVSCYVDYFDGKSKLCCNSSTLISDKYKASELALINYDLVVEEQLAYDDLKNDYQYIIVDDKLIITNTKVDNVLSSYQLKEIKK